MQFESFSRSSSNISSVCIFLSGICLNLLLVLFGFALFGDVVLTGLLFLTDDDVVVVLGDCFGVVFLSIGLSFSNGFNTET